LTPSFFFAILLDGTALALENSKGTALALKHYSSEKFLTY